MAQFRILILLTLVGCQATNNGTSNKSTQVKKNTLVIVSTVQPENKKTQKKITKATKANIHKTKKIKPSEVSDLWHRIAMQLKLPNYNDNRIEQRINWYLKHPHYMKTITKRSKPFMYHIVNQIEQRKLPLELALLPIVESDFNIKAKSPAGRLAYGRVGRDDAGFRRAGCRGRHDVVQ